MTANRKPKPDCQGTKATPSTLRARMEERLVAPIKRNAFATRTWFFVTVACVLATHGAILAYMLYRDARDPPDVAKPQETPVEVVMEQPKPPPSPPQPKAEEKQPQPVIEKPASSAPREEVTADVKTDKLDTKMEAQKADTPPQDGDRKPEEQAALDDSKADAEQDAAEQTADKKEDVLKADAEALDKATPEPKKEEPPKPPPKPKIAQVKKPKAASERMAGLTDTPEYHFAKKTKKSPVTGGNEDSRYLAIVYGMINRRIHLVGAEGSVTVSFELDNSGNVIAIALMQPSGDTDADREVINAIRLASPFPPPPPDRPHSLRATIDFSRHLSER